MCGGGNIPSPPQQEPSRRRERAARRPQPDRGTNALTDLPEEALLAGRRQLAWEDVAVRFWPTEWALLTHRQRELYREVMEDTAQLAASLGLMHPKPGLLRCRPQHREEELWARDPHRCRERGAQGTPASADQSRSNAWKREVKEEPDSPTPSWAQGTVGTKGVDPWALCPRQCEVKLMDVRSPSWGLCQGGWSPTKEELLICGTCGKSFADWESLAEHKHLHWEEGGPWACSACRKAFHYRHNFLAHKKHRGKDQQACALCGLQFCLRGDLLRHRASHSAKGASHRKSHLPAHKGRPSQKVPPQESPNYGQAERRRHQQVAHEGTGSTRCRMGFCWKEGHQLHQWLHSQEGRFTCNLCGKTYSRRGNLLTHQRRHTGEPLPIACLECGGCFASKAKLAAHHRLHRWGRPFPCAWCGRGFCSREKLQEHQASHGLTGKGLKVKEEP